MLPDIEHLIRLQELENSATEAREEIESLPSQIEAIDARVAVCQNSVQESTERLEEHRQFRATLEVSA